MAKTSITSLSFCQKFSVSQMRMMRVGMKIIDVGRMVYQNLAF